MGKKSNLPKRGKITKRTSFKLTPLAHSKLYRVARLEKFSLAYAIDEIIEIVNQMEREKKLILKFTKSKSKRKRKTYVVHLDSLSWLEERAEAENSCRDVVLETIALTIEPLLINDETLRFREYQKVYLSYISPLWNTMQKVNKKLAREFDAKNNPLIKEFQSQVNNFRNFIDYIEEDLLEGY